MKCSEKSVCVYVRDRESYLRRIHNIISRYWLVYTIWSVANSLLSVGMFVCRRKSECNSDCVRSNCNEHVLFTTLFAMNMYYLLLYLQWTCTIYYFICVRDVFFIWVDHIFLQHTSNLVLNFVLLHSVTNLWGKTIENILFVRVLL